MRRITGILFDKDGTLFDFQASWASWTHNTLHELAHGDELTARKMAKAIGFDLENSNFVRTSSFIAGTADEVAALLSPYLANQDANEILQKIDAAAALAPMVEAVPLWPLLSVFRGQGIKLGVATNDTETAARSHLQAAGVEKMFDFIAGFDSGYGGKPDPGMLKAFSDTFELAPSEVLMVGDSLHDLIAAKAAGMCPVAVLTGMAVEEDLAPHAEVVLPDIGCIPDWISGFQPK